MSRRTKRLEGRVSPLEFGCTSEEERERERERVFIQRSQAANITSFPCKCNPFCNRITNLVSLKEYLHDRTNPER
jgi:hypothetical protein